MPNTAAIKATIPISIPATIGVGSRGVISASTQYRAANIAISATWWVVIVNFILVFKL
jgi:hypothetical protein